MEEPLEIVVGHIERLARDAIVNASNRELTAGAGVDHAIRSAAGPEMTVMLTRHGPMGMRPAVMTPGFALPAKFVIHTAAPVWFLQGNRDDKIAGLALCYSACLDVAAQAGLRTIAFPALGTGIFGWPKELACRIALAAVRGTRAESQTVTFCCFTEEDAEIYRAEMAK